MVFYVCSTWPPQTAHSKQPHLPLNNLDIPHLLPEPASASMSTSLLASKDHLKQYDLGLNFIALIKPFLQEVDHLNFESDLNDSVLNLCDDGLLQDAIAPLLGHLNFTKVNNSII